MFKLLLRPRWRKVLRDLWLTKTRTLLVVLSIAVGVFAVGTIASSQIILSRDLRAMYLATILTIDWPPPEHELLVERAALSLIKASAL